ncbi:MAG: hypothetical protein IMY70_02620, partial [Bacteroidetes bacterium]|nr:hypothetical protein [Bacteroidota bacterium]
MSGKRLTGVYFAVYSNGNECEIDIDQLIEYTKQIPGIGITWNGDLKLTLQADFIVDEIKKHNLDRIVLAGDEPGIVKPIFSKAMVLSGKNP